MIYDKLCNLQRYRGLSVNIDKAIDFLSEADLFSLPQGKTVVDGENVYANRFMYETSELPGIFEDHIKRLDVHLVLAGAERLQVAPAELLTERTPYSEQDDIRMLTGDGASDIVIHAGEFALVFPGEAHIPKLACGRAAAVDKLVVKIVWEG